jgi:hypothetical protein
MMPECWKDGEHYLNRWQYLLMSPGVATSWWIKDPGPRLRRKRIVAQPFD